MLRTSINTIFYGFIFAIYFYTSPLLSETASGKLTGDPTKILHKPIPDKLIVLTFDDAPASHATVVAPILKSLNFGGTFYICDFDSFKTRKDWYLTFRQMKSMAEDGFEIGNHTKGHGGSLSAFLAMEDDLLAHYIPKPSTVCWPVYAVNWGICSDLTSKGYSFGRGGHERPYRPTLDNPFDIPSFTIRDGTTVEAFIKQAQQACQGRIVVYCFHGVPDMEHPSVGLEPATFKIMMQYLKDNNYKVISARDLSDYIDPVKAAKLPQASRPIQVETPFETIKDDKPYLATASKEIRNFEIPGVSVQRSQNNFVASAPYALDITRLAPKFETLAGAKVEPKSGTIRDFTNPQIYKVTGIDGNAQTYTVSVKRHLLSTVKDVIKFELPEATATSISRTSIGVYVPLSTNVKTLAPTLILSPFAKSVPASGTVRDFTKSQNYTITAQDGSTCDFLVTVIKSDKPNSFHWNGATSGNWSDTSKWKSASGEATSLNPSGQPDYILNINKAEKSELYNDLKDSFQLHQLNLNLGQGSNLKLNSKGLRFTTNPTTGVPPSIRVNALFERSEISGPISLASDLTINLSQGAESTLNGPISGSGSLLLNSTDFKPDMDWYGYRPCVLRIDNKVNTYTGGTIISGGQLFLFVANQGLGTGPVKMINGGRVRLENAHISNPLNSSNSMIEGGGSWNAPIVLNGTNRLSGNIHFNPVSDGISGTGGLMLMGSRGPFNWTNNGTVMLSGNNTYSGPTTILKGTLRVKKPYSLYNANSSLWTPEHISVAPAATLSIDVGGLDEFTGEQSGILLNNLTKKINNNGLMARSIFNIDTSNASQSVVLSNDITDSNGPEGGAFVLKKSGIGILQLSGNNSYSGQTILENGALHLASFNSVSGGKPSSSLGAPKDIEAGEIFIGNPINDSNCSLIYSGVGESSDRVINLAGKNSTLTFDHSGTGLLKLSQPFLISGHSFNKNIILTGDSTGVGEIAGIISDPYDRIGKATTKVTKSGSGTWILSGNNLFSGSTTISQGTLSLTNSRSLSSSTEVLISVGAILDLNFAGELKVGKLLLNGVSQAKETYNAVNTSKFIKGTGTLTICKD